jgi:hypothetical protein
MNAQTARKTDTSQAVLAINPHSLAAKTDCVVLLDRDYKQMVSVRLVVVPAGSIMRGR